MWKALSGLLLFEDSICGDGKVLLSVLSNVIATSCMWLLSSRNVVSLTKALNF